MSLGVPENVKIPPNRRTKSKVYNFLHQGHLVLKDKRSDSSIATAAYCLNPYLFRLG